MDRRGCRSGLICSCRKLVLHTWAEQHAAARTSRNRGIAEHGCRAFAHPTKAVARHRAIRLEGLVQNRNAYCFQPNIPHDQFTSSSGASGGTNLHLANDTYEIRDHAMFPICVSLSCSTSHRAWRRASSSGPIVEFQCSTI